MIETSKSALQPAKRTTLLDLATEALLNTILNGEVSSGERINETAFTAKLEISRATFREAMRQLEQAGLLIRVPFRGTFVREFSQAEIKDLNNLRGVLETYAAEIIVEKGANSAEALAPLYQIVSQMEGVDLEADAAKTNALHISFHRTMLDLAENGPLYSVWNDLSQQFWVAMRASQLSSIAQDKAEDFAEAHRAVVDAIADGDMDQIRSVIRMHVAG